MLTFEEKIAIIESFPQLERKNVSLKRVNFQLQNSMTDKRNVVFHLHPNGNGFVYAGNLPSYSSDEKGMVNIRDYSESDLRILLKKSIDSLTQVAITEAPKFDDSNEKQESKWMNENGDILLLIEEDQLWNVYFGRNLDAAYESYVEAVEYLEEEGFRKV